jgi:hypothetical protein
VLRTLLANRAEQQLSEAAMSARADDKEVSSLGFLDENLGGSALFSATLDRHTIYVSCDFFQSVVESGRGALAKVFELSAGWGQPSLEAGSADVAELPRVDDAEGRLP